MKIINQTNFAYGEVDPVLLGATDQPQYLEALASGKNIYITSQRTISKRPGSVFSFAQDIATDLTLGTKSISFANGENKWITAIIFLDTAKTNIQLFLYDWTTGNVEPSLVHPVTADSIDEFSIDATNDFIVISSLDNPTLEAKIDFNTITATTISPINFSVIPSVDTGEIDYSKWQFVLSGTPLGTTITIHNVVGAGFTQAYVGGLVIEEQGATVEQPLASGLIQTVGAVSGGTQVLTLIVTSPFSKDATTTGGAFWSVRKPIWSPTLGYARLCSFHGGRLFLVGTKKYPSFIAGSRENTYNDFNVKAGNDVDSIAYLMQEPKGGAVTHLFGGLNLNIWTSETQYIAWSGLDVGLTPKNFYPRAVSNYTISKNDPIRYKDNTYFVTSDGKSIIEMTESYQDAKVVDISFSAKHLVNNPLFASVSVLPSEREQIIYFVNEDETVFSYSKADTTGVNAFCPTVFSLPENCSILTIENVDNKTYLFLFDSTTQFIYTFELKANFYLDFSINVTFSNKTAAVSPFYADGSKLALIKEESGITTFYGLFDVASSTITADVEDGNYAVGYLYDVDISSMNNIASPQNVFFTNKVVRDAVSFYQTYGITVNGKSFATQNIFGIQESGAVLQNGIADLGNANGGRNFQQINIKQSAPYPCNIQSIGYAVEGDVIL